jgi:glycosyltransferase involved in cell wall biosynthesis
LTFFVMAFNQEAFVEKAIRGALAQTYSPLEVILSDDCSTDATFEIMTERARSYSGPHHVVLNRNESNLGIARHVNRVMELANGELVIVAAGDDYSIPERTQVIFDRWESGGRRAFSIGSYVINFNEKTEILVRRPIPQKNRDLAWRGTHFTPGILGAAHAWHRRIFEEFGPINRNVVAEDRVIVFRAYCLGDVEMIERPLVHHRTHQGSMSFWPLDNPQAIREKLRSHSLERRQTLLQYLCDLDHELFEKYSDKEVSAARRKIVKALWVRNAEDDMIFARHSLGAVLLLTRALLKGSNLRRTWRTFVMAHLPGALRNYRLFRERIFSRLR